MGGALAAAAPDRALNRDAEARRTAAARQLAWVLDETFRVPGTNLRFGIDPVLGLFPVGGDLAAGVLSAYILLAAARVGAPPSVLARMGVNIAVDAIAGSVPLLGDLFDAGFKANRRNARLLDAFAAAPGPVRRSSRLVLASILLLLTLVLIGVGVLGIVILRWIVARL